MKLKLFILFLFVCVVGCSQAKDYKKDPNSLVAETNSAPEYVSFWQDEEAHGNTVYWNHFDCGVIFGGMNTTYYMIENQFSGNVTFGENTTVIYLEGVN